MKTEAANTRTAMARIATPKAKTAAAKTNYGLKFVVYFK